MSMILAFKWFCAVMWCRSYDSQTQRAAATGLVYSAASWLLRRILFQQSLGEHGDIDMLTLKWQSEYLNMNTRVWWWEHRHMGIWAHEHNLKHITMRAGTWEHGHNSIATISWTCSDEHDCMLILLWAWLYKHNSMTMQVQSWASYHNH